MSSAGPTLRIFGFSFGRRFLRAGPPPTRPAAGDESRFAARRRLCAPPEPRAEGYRDCEDWAVAADAELDALIAALADAHTAMTRKRVACRLWPSIRATSSVFEPLSWKAKPPETPVDGLILDFFVNATRLADDRDWQWYLSATRRGSTPWEVERTLDLVYGDLWQCEQEWPTRYYQTTQEMAFDLTGLLDELYRSDPKDP
jgi:hypothetical protein